MSEVMQKISDDALESVVGGTLSTDIRKHVKTVVELVRKTGISNRFEDVIAVLEKDGFISPQITAYAKSLWEVDTK